MTFNFTLYVIIIILGISAMITSDFRLFFVIGTPLYASCDLILGICFLVFAYRISQNVAKETEITMNYTKRKKSLHSNQIHPLNNSANTNDKFSHAPMIAFDQQTYVSAQSHSQYSGFDNNNGFNNKMLTQNNVNPKLLAEQTQEQDSLPQMPDTVVSFTANENDTQPITFDNASFIANMNHIVPRLKQVSLLCAFFWVLRAIYLIIIYAKRDLDKSFFPNMPDRVFEVLCYFTFEWIPSMAALYVMLKHPKSVTTREQFLSMQETYPQAKDEYTNSNLA